jgi:hypothetical protein
LLQLAGLDVFAPSAACNQFAKERIRDQGSVGGAISLFLFLGLQRNLWVLFGNKRAAKEEIAAAGLVSAGFQVLANSSAIPIRNPGAS